MKSFNRVYMTTPTSGTGDTITLGSAISDAFLTLAEAGGVAGNLGTVVVEDGNDFGIYKVTVGASAATIEIDEVIASKIGGTAGTSKLDLSGSATVRFVEDAIIFNKLKERLDARIGSFFLHGAASPPTGALKRNGAAVLIASYPALAAAIYCGDGNNATASWGYKATTNVSPSSNRSTSGTYIVLPDGRGEFDRGWDDSRGVDSGRTLWSYQGHQLQLHTHTYQNDTGTVGRDGTNSEARNDNYIDRQTDTGGSTGNFGTETRPRNVAGLPCIWFE